MLMKLRLRVLAWKIEWHWLFITPGRKKGNAMIDDLFSRGQSLNSPELMALNSKVSRHCTRVTALTEQYIKLAE